MNDQHQSSTGETRRPFPITAKQRGSVKHAVDRLLDELAPERAASRIERAPVAELQRHRTPRGCILQATKAAVSVSWFPDGANDAEFGELQIVVWKGVVTRRGSGGQAENATSGHELVLRPVERPPEGWTWQAKDGTAYDNDALVAHILALLAGQVNGAGTTAAG